MAAKSVVVMHDDNVTSADIDAKLQKVCVKRSIAKVYFKGSSLILKSFLLALVYTISGRQVVGNQYH